MKKHVPHEHGNNLEPPHFWTHPNHHAIIVEIPIDGETSIVVGFTAPFKAGTFQGVVLSRGTRSASKDNATMAGYPQIVQRLAERAGSSG